ncbi:MAG TPA: glycosyltransferase family 39 protein [Rhodocyclaceae bacterium]|nr:glycosyltransferase family 39 protein [Rhodocyclaceae bacterium]
MTARRQTLLLFLLALLVFGLGIWEPTGVTGKDEFYLGLRTPMEMMAGNHWLVPFLDGAPRIRKPPLLYWLGRLSYETFGISLTSARLVATLFAALLVAATAGIARRLTRESHTGLVAGLILLTFLGLHTEGRRFMLDVPVAACSTAAFWSLLAWLDNRRWPWLTLTALLLAAGFLLKGPVVTLVFGGGVLALLASRRLSPASLLPQWRSLAANVALCLGLALPWFFLVRALYPEAAQLAFADEMESRHFLQPTPEIILGLINVALPWIFVFLAAAWARCREPHLPRLLLVWFLASFLPFLFIKSFDRYLVGSLAPMAIFLAWSLPGLTARWPFRLGLAVALLLGGGLAVFALWFRLGGWYWLLAPALYFAWAWWQERGLAHTIAAPALFWIALLWGVFPALGVNGVPPDVVELGRTRAIAMFDGPQPAMLPILSRQPHRHYSAIDRHDAAELAALGALVFAEGKDVPRLLAELDKAGYLAHPAGQYRTLASHGSALRFARVGASGRDWREAWIGQRLDPLLTTIEWFEIKPR